MESIIVPPFLQVIFEKIIDPVLRNLDDFLELEDRLMKLKRILPRVQAIIRDAEERQISDDPVKLWLSQLKHDAYKVEDLLEEFKHKQKGIFSTNFRDPKLVLDDFQKVAEEGLRLNLAEKNIVDKRVEGKETSSFVIPSKIYGREEDKRKIIDMLVGSVIPIIGTPGIGKTTKPSGEVGSVIPIVGPPCIGKTTLAQIVYNDDKVMDHFKDLRIWIFVSRNLNVRSIMKDVIERSTGKEYGSTNLDRLQNKMLETLKEKKFLLVLDDVWNEDPDDWEDLRPLFRCGLDGSKILVTARNQKAAMAISNSETAYPLKGLSNDDCWKIFKERAFTQTEEEEYPNLQAIGKELTPKFGGVPLAAKILGGFMHSKRNERQWVDVQESNLWNLEAYKNKFLPALLVSYMHMPLHLKHCFVFCSLYPKNYEIKREKLVRMWMALGLIRPDGVNKALEDIGDEYFNELLLMSVFENVKEHEGGGYNINENFQSLAQFLTENEYLVVENEFAAGIDLEQVHHASIVIKYGSSSSPALAALRQAKHLRTLLVFSEGGDMEDCSQIFKLFPYLRILDLSGCQVQLLSMDCLALLKYLDLSNNLFSSLPSEISSLCSLETLNLFDCYNLESLPDLSDITGLRHLNISGCEALKFMPNGIGSLDCLQTLPIFIVNVGNIFGLKDLKLLRGELKIKHLGRVNNIEAVNSMPLMNKEYLESLGLCWGNEAVDMNPALEANITRFQERKHHAPGPSEEPIMHVFDRGHQGLAWEVLECLQPPKNLKKMFVVGYPGIKFPHWILPYLTEMVLINCRGCMQLPILGHLPLLRTLRMEGMDDIERIGPEFCGEEVASFRSLRELFMIDFPRLRELFRPYGRKKIPLLSKLVIRKCPNLVLLPLFLFSSLNHLEMQGCRSIMLNSMEISTPLSQIWGIKIVMSLSTLIIEGFDDLSYLPEDLLRNYRHLTSLKIKSCPKLQFLGSGFRFLTSLKSLSIQWCEQLSLLPEGFENLDALEYFEIIECDSIETLPENPIGGLRSLQILSIENCSSLSSISAGIQHLAALKQLTIMYCPELAGLPDSLEHLSSLLSLTIISCPLIECLPEGLRHVKTLQSLEIRNCERIVDLPEWLDSFASMRTLAISECPNMKSLPAAFGRLKKLQHLSIQDCPELQRRCQREGGEDWWKVSRVPHRWIFSSQQQ